MRLSSCLRPAVFASLAVALAPVLTSEPVRAQFAHELRGRVVSTEAPFNFFLDWEGSLPLEGLEISLPADWTLNGIDVVQQGFVRLPGRLERLESAETAYRFHLQRAVRGATQVVLRLTAPASPAEADVTVIPLQRSRSVDDGYELQYAYEATRRARVRQAPPSNANRALVLDGDQTEPLRFRSSRIPDLGSEGTFSVEYWLRTTALDRVVLSTWDGDERSPYPIEMVVGLHGRLLYYRGRPGEHQAMCTVRPIADGDWHHVALVYDASAGWTRLFLDGEAQDSLYAPHHPRIDMPEHFEVGGRPGRDAASEAHRFEGQIDELRIWSVARPASAIRQGMRRSLTGAGSEGIFLSFETAIPPDLLARPVTTRRERSDLSFAHPVQDLRASVEDGQVALTWQTSDRETASFVIERSSDGRDFLEVGRLGAEETLGESSAEGTQRYRFSEAQVGEQVVYYRIRQRLVDGSERMTASVKIGLGRVDPYDEAMLVGNYPNPFNALTTITYRLEESMQVRLSVWDVAGQPVAELVDAVQDEGFYEIPFDAGELSSGTYFVRLQTPADVGWGTITLMK